MTNDYRLRDDLFMDFFGRGTRCVLVSWAIFLIIALSAFASHSHAPDDVDAAPCAICLVHNVSGIASIVAASVLSALALVWRVQRWFAAQQSPIIAATARLYLSRGPPVEAPSAFAN